MNHACTCELDRDLALQMMYDYEQVKARQKSQAETYKRLQQRDNRFAATYATFVVVLFVVLIGLWGSLIFGWVA